jgi:hypothetical protein
MNGIRQDMGRIKQVRNLARRPVFAGLVGTLCLLLMACTDNPNCPPLPGGAAYCLQSSTAVPAFTALQDLRLHGRGLDERLIAQLEVDNDGMRLAGLTPMGQRVLEARFDNHAATADSLAGSAIDARALLSLVQVATWPADTVRAGLMDGWTLEETPDRRRILHNEQVFMEILRVGSPPRYTSLTISLPRIELMLTVVEIVEEGVDAVGR